MAILLAKREIDKIVANIGLDQIMDDLLIKLKQGILNFSESEIACPERSGFSYTHPVIGLIEWMPLFIKSKHQIAIKTVGYHPDNPALKALPTILSNTALYDSTTGELLCIFDSTLATAMRTGAATAVASKALAAPNSSIFGFIGCGAQAITQLHALSRVFGIKKVLYYDSNSAVQNSFESRCATLNIDAEFCQLSIESIVNASDVICTATTIDVGAGPLFEVHKTLPHVHLNAVGSDFPGKIELPKSLLKASFVCPDHLAQAKKEGECQQLEDYEIAACLAEVVQQPDKFEIYKSKRTVFDSTGWAFEDWVVMDLFMEYAVQLGLNERFSLNDKTDDVKNPYAVFQSLVVPV